MSNKNDLPSWLDAPEPGGDENKNETPPGDASSADADLPPWLREDAPAASGVKRIAPPAGDTPAGDLPPWLADEAKPKTAFIGGAELSADYLSAGDQLVDRVESDISYDDWIAQQAEAARPKSIDEEIPDLLSDIPQTGPLPPPGGGQTGILPDWFLGLEELDERDIPDWFKDAREVAPPQTGKLSPDEVVPWMSDLVPTKGAAPAPPPAELPPDEDVASFFNNLGSGFTLEEEDEPVIDWFANPQSEAPPPEDDFYAQFGAPPPPEPLKAVVPTEDEEFYAQFLAQQSDDEPEAAFDEAPSPTVAEFLTDEYDEPAPPLAMDDAEDDEELPAIDLPDDLFAALGKSKAPPPDVEEPDVSWFLNMPQTGALSAADLEDEIAGPTQISRPKLDDNTLSWLSEIENIVTSAAHQPEADEPNDFETTDIDDWEAANTTAPAARRADEFAWGDEEFIEAEAEEAPADAALDWLSAVEEVPPNPEPDAETDFSTFGAPPTSSQRPRLSGLLRMSEPEAPEQPEAEEAAETPEQPAAIEPTPAVAPLDAPWDSVPTEIDWEEVPEPDISFTDELRDFDFAALDTPRREDSGSFEQVDMDDFLRGLDLEPSAEPSPEAAAEPGFTDLLRGMLDAPPEAEAAPLVPPSEDIPDEELYSGWLTDELLADDDAEPAVPTTDEDFFARIARDADANVLAEVSPNFELPTLTEPEFEAQDELAALNDAEIEFPDFSWDETAEEPDQAPLLADLTQPDALEDNLLSAAAPNLDDWAQPSEDEFALEAEEPLPNDSDLLSMFAALDEPSEPTFSEELLTREVDWLGDEDFTERMFDNATAKLAREDDSESPTAVFGKQPDADEDLSMFEDIPEPEFDVDTLFAEFDAVTAMDVDLPEPERPPTGALPTFDAVAAFEAEGDADALALPVEDINTYLQALGDAEVQKSSATMMSASEVDLDTLFGQDLLAAEPDLPNPDLEGLAPATGLDWLEANVVGSVSAGAIARQMEDAKQPDELPDRLKRLRQRAEKLSDEQTEAPAETDALAKVLPGVSATLAPAPLRTDEVALVSALTLTPTQTEQVNLLKSMLALDIKPQKLSAIELTYDSPFAPDLEDQDQSVVVGKETDVVPVAEAKPRRERRLPVERWLVALILLAAVIAPFYVTTLRVGDLPPAAFAPNTRQAAAFDRIDALRPGDLLLLGVEYGATTAAELDLLTDSLIRHALLRGARPVVISGNPVALLRTENLLRTINADADFLARLDAPGGLTPNFDYFVVRYLPGSVLGLRAFSANTAALLLNDVRGQATQLNATSLDDFALITVVAERPEDLRAYAEQVAPLTGVPVIAAVPYSAEPLAAPYAESPLSGGMPVAGLLVGYGDGYTYSAQLASVNAVSRGAIPALPTPVYVEPPPVAADPTPDSEPAATPEPGSGEAAAPDATAEAAAESDGAFGVVDSSGSVRLRGGPGTSFTIVDNLSPGTRVEILGYNEAEDWANVRLADGREGWISAPLLRLEAPKRAPKPFAQDETPTRRPTNTPRPTRTLSPTVETPMETVEATAEAVVEVSAPPPISERDARWYAQTLGTLAAAALIMVGMVVGVIRALVQRRRTS